MHLINILNQKKATEDQKEKAIVFFKTNTVSHSSVSDFLKSNS
jgi:hydroxymethylglutaryl-CoA reductase